MPTSATGTPRSKTRLATVTPAQRSGGFTLIEILVVIIVVAILVSVALISSGTLRDDRDLQVEATRIAALLELALDEATLQGREFGIELMLGGYRFVEYDTLAGVWVEIPGDDMLRIRDLPEELELELYLEGKRVLLDDEPAEFDDPDEMQLSRVGTRYSPHLLIYSSGDVTPFELHVIRDHDDQRRSIHVDTLGNVRFDVEDDERS